MKEQRRLSFPLFNRLCERNTGNKYVSECIHCIRSEDCLYFPGLIMPYDHIFSLYSTRLKIAKDKVTDADFISDFERTVDSMKEIKSNDLGLVSLHTESYTYVVFYEPDNEIILGILRSKNNEGLRDLETLQTEQIAQGLTSSMLKYSKGVFVRDWKRPS
ncbi:hypothetical protein F0L74_29610 [Chitinophaga agrisoli]|uniref:Uncharacterized protein n=1 Tax=Chitinophaga agrisoli TaxID=2607653 RepID=A0A5B2VNR2_9BACT|nr:hypothetical protein [Chitinophaga agrisoli]KAA2240320.1 hypothetical protein F0L74_29610 [Chitinophaga agrisoli]